MESHNLMALSLHIRNICVSTSKTSFAAVRQLTALDAQHRSLLGEHLFLQADASITRGRIGDAETLMSLALPLIRETRTDLFQCSSALFSTVLLLQNKRRAALQWHNRASSAMEEIEKTSVYYSHKVLHAAIRHAVVECDFHAALSCLSRALTPFLIREDCSPLKYVIWSFSAWLYFLLGRANKMDELLHSLRPKDKDNVLMCVWYLEFKAVSCIMRGLYNKTRKALVALKATQRGLMGTVYHSALSGILAACKKDHLSMDADTRDECINTVIFATQKLACCQAVKAVPIAVVTLFLSAHCAVSILGQLHRVVGLRRGGGVRHRLTQCVESALLCLGRVAVVIPFVSLLVEALQMKQDVLSHNDSGKKPSIAPTATGLSGATAKMERFKDFGFGLAFWYAERSQHCTYFNNGKSGYAREASYCRSRSRELFQSYGLPAAHFLLGALCDNNMSP